jgi:hypothetical protein
MIKRIGIILSLAILITIAFGCSHSSSNVTPTPQANISQVRQAQVAKIWTVRQLEINLDNTTSILLKLAAGDTVDGYYFLEQGDNVDFSISGQSQMYKSTAATAGSANITSDRFSFKANNDQGIAYTLKFSPVKTTETHSATPVIFIEIIYPVTGEIFTPLDTK